MPLPRSKRTERFDGKGTPSGRPFFCPQGTRRAFLKGIAAAAAAAPLGAFPYDAIPPLRVSRRKIEIGLDKPVSILHVSDSHLARIDSRDGDSVWNFYRVRSRIGRELGEWYLSEALRYADGEGLRIVHTGDIFDFASEANVEYVERLFKNRDTIFCVGNHEFWLDRGTIEEGEKSRTAGRLEGIFGDALAPRTIDMGGFSIFTFDNSFGRVSKRTAAAFERLAAKGEPIVLAMHVPFFFLGAAHLYRAFGGNASALAAKMDATTAAFVERIRSEPLVKAILCGHLHASGENSFSPTADEYVSAALFDGFACRFDFT